MWTHCTYIEWSGQSKLLFLTRYLGEWTDRGVRRLAEGVGDKCKKYADYQPVLTVFTHISRTQSRSKLHVNEPSTYTKYRYLSSPEKSDRLHQLRHQHLYTQKFGHLQVKLKEAIQHTGVTLDGTVTVDLHQVMQEEQEKMVKQFLEGSFQHIFWQQQKHAAAQNKKRGMQ